MTTSRSACKSDLEIWQRLSKEVNRVFLKVDARIDRYPNWLQSMRCDLTDLQKVIVQAFNVDVRRSPVESKRIRLKTLDGDIYYCYNGLFLRHIQSIAPDAQGVNPSFGELSLLSTKPIQTSIVCEQRCRFFVLDKVGVLEAKSYLIEKRAERLLRFLE